MGVFMNRLSVFMVALVLGLGVYASVGVAQGSSAGSVISNEFIKIIVNEGPQDLGRFSVETTQGDPSRDTDDAQPLIYGRPVPWTSYTTVMIDGMPYVFGGLSTRTQKRSPSGVQFGTVVSHNVLADRIETVCRFGSDVLVKQTVQFARNAATQVQDTALISYAIVNEGTSARDIGIRVLLDTKLGSNDGAPFRIGSDAVESEVFYPKKDLFDYWQTFDSLSSPNVIAQGTLIDSRYEVTPPDRMYLVNWGTLFSFPWNFVYEKGRSFMREGESEKDTALALYFDPAKVLPGQTRSVHTMYGLGGVKLSAGELALGISAPSELFSTSRTPFLMMVYLRNSGQFLSHATTVKVTLPAGLSAENGITSFSLGDVAPGETRQVPIRVFPSLPSIGRNRIVVEALSSTLPSNQLTHDIKVDGPAKLKAKLEIPSEWVPEDGPYVKAKLSVTNPSGYKISNVLISLDTVDGVKVPDFDIASKRLSALLPQKTQTVNWMMKLDASKDQVPITVTLSSPDMNPDRVKGSIKKGVSVKDLFATKVMEKDGFVIVDISASPSFFKKGSQSISVSFLDDEIRLLRARPTGPYNWSDDIAVSSLPGSIHFVVKDLSKLTQQSRFSLYFKKENPDQKSPIVIRNGLTIVKEISL
jgi:hypothetical protein